MVQGSDNTGAPSAASAAVNANVGKTQTPAALANVQQNINDQSSGLAKRAADYTSQQEAGQNYGLDTNTLDRAIAGDNTASSATTGLLNRSNINQFDSFDPGDTTVKNAALLGSNAGLQQLAAQGQGPQYNPGMAAFDTMLLQRDPSFNAQVNQLQAQNAALQTNAQAQPAALQKTVADYGTQNLANSQAQAKSYLMGQQGGITAAEQAAADAAAKNLYNPQQQAAMNAQSVAAAQKQAQDALDAQFGVGRATSQLGGVTGVDPSKFISYLSGYDPSQFINAQQAQQYNQINSLLGLGGQSQVASAGAPPNPYTIDTQGLMNAYLAPAQQARVGQDTADTNQINSILAALNTQATERNKSGLATAAGYGDNLNAYGNSLFPTFDQGLAPYETADNLTKFNNQFAASNPINSYYTTPVQGTDLLSADQAAQLNALQNDLGTPQNSYSAGTAAGAPPPSSFDQSAYGSALMAYLKGLVPTPPPTPVTAPPVSTIVGASSGPGGLNELKPGTSPSHDGPGNDVQVTHSGSAYDKISNALNSTGDKLNAGVNNATNKLGKGLSKMKLSY